MKRIAPTGGKGGRPARARPQRRSKLPLGGSAGRLPGATRGLRRLRWWLLLGALPLIALLVWWDWPPRASEQSRVPLGGTRCGAFPPTSRQQLVYQYNADTGAWAAEESPL